MRKSYLLGSLTAMLASLGLPTKPNPYPEADTDNRSEFDAGAAETKQALFEEAEQAPTKTAAPAKTAARKR